MAFFITFEGIEGCGKSTQAGLLAKRLTGRRMSVLTTREPGGCPIADAIRQILLDPANTTLVPRAELLLYAAARAQHVTEVIEPALRKGLIVICDRFTDATLAYQGFGRGLDIDLIHTLNQVATGGIQPDLTLLLDMPQEEGLKRAIQRNTAASLAHEERFERETLEFHGKVRNGYRQMAGRSDRFRVIDAQGNIDTVAGRINQAVDEFICSRNAAP
ncbi:MAG: dTMP kinase [Desulfuromonadaceae bacterium GWC2_58_13]|nr:MAG: dTMP kinase [Desulfuromonadaceae bacterium GWC2_58_13]